MTDAELLQAYKDTGLEPEQIETLKTGTCLGCSVPELKEGQALHKEWEEAYQQGRLVELPCKVGDELFFVWNGKIFPAVVRLLLWDYRKDKGVHSEILANPNPYFSIGASFDDFGKTVFLAREEAEKALEGGQANA